MSILIQRPDRNWPGCWVLREGEVRIKRKDGQVFVIRSEAKRGSPFDVPGVDLGMSAAEIAHFVRAGRRYGQG